MLSALTGHSSTQVPQSMQMSSLTSALSFTFIASTGQADSQAAQPVQIALSTFTAIMSYLVAPLILVFLFIFYYRALGRKYASD